MDQSRRGFLGLLGGLLGSALVLDPEKALWVPGKKLISIPAIQTPTIIRGNRLLTVNEITEQMLSILKSNLELTKSIFNTYDSAFNQAQHTHQDKGQYNIRRRAVLLP